jgi:hypothetical protein
MPSPAERHGVGCGGDHDSGDTGIAQCGCLVDMPRPKFMGESFGRAGNQINDIGKRRLAVAGDIGGMNIADSTGAKYGGFNAFVSAM